MTSLRLIFLLLGLSLLTALLWQADLSAIFDYVKHLGWGLAAVLAVYLAAFLAATLSWHLLIPSARLDRRWFYHLWKVRMVGASINRITPFVGLGGEPVKAVLLKKFHALDYREGVASLVVAKTANLIALILYLSGGLAITIISGDLPQAYQIASAMGLAVLAIGITVLFAVQRFKLTSAMSARLSRHRLGKRLVDILHHIEDMDERLVKSYTRDRKKFCLAVLLTLINWMLGMVEIYLILLFLGHPVSMAEAWSIDAMLELARAMAFFIPGTIGVQEGALTLIIRSITGDASLGLAVALVRRGREIIWIVWGFLIGWRYSKAPESADLKSSFSLPAGD